MKNFIKKHNRLVVCLLITACFITLTATVFSDSFNVFATSATQLWNSLVGYFRFMVFFEAPTNNPIQLPPTSDSSVLPSSPSGFWSDLGEFFVLLGNGQNFMGYLGFVGGLLMTLLRISPFVLPMFFVLRWVAKRSLTKHNNDYNRDTKALRAFKRVSDKTYAPTKRYLASLWEFITVGSFKEKEGKLVAKYRLPWLKIWLIVLLSSMFLHLL